MAIRSTPWAAGSPCWVDMAVVDIKGAQRFYGSVLGWTFVDTGERLGHYTLCTTGSRNVAALFRPMPGGEPVPWTVYLATQDLDASVDAVLANGGTIAAEPMHIPGVGALALAVDPCGAVFGMWQETGMIGFGIVDEPGAVVWTEARLTDPAAGAKFYSAVFGHTHRPVPGAGGDERTIHLGESGEPVGGLSGTADGPSHWLTSFAVADLDEAVARLTAAGGTVVTPAAPTPFGRAGVYADPAGVTFALSQAPAAE